MDNSPPAVTFGYPEAAATLGISIRSLKRAVAEGSIRHVRMGRAVRFRQSDIDSYLEDHARGGAPEKGQR